MRKDRRAVNALITLFAAAGIVVTLFGQVPSASFGRARSRDWFGVVPNWRFFAPTPAQHDFAVYTRPLAPDGRPTVWTRPRPIPERRLIHAVWFPGRRADKALFDLCGDLLPLLDIEDPSRIEHRPAFKVLRAWAIADLRAVGAPDVPHQLALVRYAGSDDRVAPEVVFTSSPFELDADAQAAGQHEPGRRVRRPRGDGREEAAHGDR